MPTLLWLQTENAQRKMHKSEVDILSDCVVRRIELDCEASSIYRLHVKQLPSVLNVVRNPNDSTANVEAHCVEPSFLIGGEWLPGGTTLHICRHASPLGRRSCTLGKLEIVVAAWFDIVTIIFTFVSDYPAALLPP